MRTYVLIALFALGLASIAQAQVSVAPTTMTFSHPDAEFAITASYEVSYFTCSSVTVAGVCNGKASAPFQAGSIVPKAQVTGTAAARVISLLTAPESGVLASMPSGQGFVANVQAIGDTAQPGIGGISPFSPDSNPFFASARVPAAPGKPTVP